MQEVSREDCAVVWVGVAGLDQALVVAIAGVLWEASVDRSLGPRDGLLSVRSILSWMAEN